MATNTYAIAPNFPVGVIPGQLNQYMVSVWPPDLFPMDTLARSKPDSNGVLTTGNIEIETQRELTTQENDDALAAFQLFVPLIIVGGGRLISQLEAGSRNGQTVFVTDEPRQGSGTGVLCYWDQRDRTWRRIRDDATVAVIPSPA